MSEFPFADQAESFEDEAGDKKNLLIAGGVAAALVLGAGAYFLTSGGGTEDDAFVVPKRAPRAAPAAPVVKAPTKVPVVFAAPVGRDPFRALYTVPVAAAAAPVGTTPTTTTPTQAPTTGGSTVVITPTQAPSSGGGTTAPQQQSQSTIRFKGFDPDTKVGTFVLDGKTTLTGKVGAVLAKKILIVAMRPDREPGTFFATLKVGDGAQFDAHYGQTVVIP